MALSHSPSLVLPGLSLCLDAANPKSYPGSGTTWTDLSGNGNNGTLVNGVGYNSGNLGSLSFDGVNDYVTATRPSSIITGGSISVSVWAKWTTAGTTIGTIQVLVDNNHSNSPVRGFVIQDRPDLSKVLTFSASPGTNTVSSTFQVGDGTWRHIVGTADTTTRSLYIDGVLNNTVSGSGGLATVQPNINIGRWNSGIRYLNGNIAQVSIYNRALTPQEIQQNFNALRSRFSI
jgi:hypothetical protein